MKHEQNVIAINVTNISHIRSQVSSISNAVQYIIEIKSCSYTFVLQLYLDQQTCPLCVRSLLVYLTSNMTILLL